MVITGNKNVFWQALVFTIFVFGAGLVFGYYIEASRASRVEFNLLNSELNLLDEQLRSRIIGESNLSCSLAIDSTFSFADKIYGEAVKLENYDASSKFNRETMLALHKRYDLLRTMLWEESIKLKKRCSFHTVVYFFDYATEDVEKKGRQEFFSRLLIDLKDEHPSEVLLIPIASNLDIASVEIITEIYGIKSSPGILIDEKKYTNEIITLKELEELVFSKK